MHVQSVDEASNPPIKPGPKPSVNNDPQDILRTWTALEVLAPQGYRRETDLVGGEMARLAWLKEGPLPWEVGEKSRPKKRLYYELILGTINLGPAVEALLKLYADNRPDAPSINQRAPIASVILDKDGRPLEDETSFVISSFAWAVPIALLGDLKRLADWPTQERSLVKAFREKLIHKDEDGEIIPVTKPDVDGLYSHLVDVLALTGHDISPPRFAIRRYEFFASKVPPEPSLLNSFFLDDLAKARDLARTEQLPQALKFYLGVSSPQRRTDLLQEDAGLQYLLQPALTAPGRWPGQGRFPLALLQQAAVNGTNDGLKQTGVLSVNGPPGTGKTTLLRDIVAARVVERAIVMADFKNPDTAFSPTNQTFLRSGAKITLHRLDGRLKGFEMVVASSNNKAVENVSAELPAIDAIASDATELRYFKSISDAVLGRDTWGMIAAVLGNSSNRFQFSQSFWRDEERGFSTYLNHAAGVPQFVAEPQQDGPPIKRLREVVAVERPPGNKREALANWERARASFQQALAGARRTQAALQETHICLIKLQKLAIDISATRAELPAFERQAGELEERVLQSVAAFEQAETAAHGWRNALSAHASKRPGFFARLFGTEAARSWVLERDRISEQCKAHTANAETRHREDNELKAEHGRRIARLTEKRDQLASQETEHRNLALKMSQASAELSAPIPDDAFFSRNHEEVQIASVWFDKAQQVQRDGVFEAAMALHRAFIDCAADPMRQNLSIFLETFGTRTLGSNERDAVIADLWSSFFLAVPVISTTFASVNRMFSRLNPATLGWLLIDEAGQASPQAAVGAMMRSKRAVIVGDPLQIEPVVTLPSSLTEEICAFFGVDPLKYDAPEASVQTIADRASPYCARFPIGSGHRDVGAPLLVHRRCDSPMFDVSNEIAYANLMVQAKTPSGRALPLGRSCWFDVVGKPGPDKWCADEGTKIIELLKTLRASGAAPDLYVITPFVIVQDTLRQQLLASRVLHGWVEKPDSWVWQHVGTVHTVQGREAETVFFVLGAQAPSQKGARAWAGGRPNLVNVAITRAKSAFYVIGNRDLWKSAGAFSALDRHLPPPTAS